jgi:anti-anti-sigma factor
MVIDLTVVDYVGSAGPGMLGCAYGTLSEKKGGLRLCGVCARVLSLLQLTKTDAFPSIDPRRKESLAALQN